MAFKTNLTAALIALLSTASVLAMPAPSQAEDGCGRAYRFFHRQQRCARRTDVGPRVSPRVVYQPAVVRPVLVSPVVRPLLRPVIRPVIQLSL